MKAVSEQILDASYKVANKELGFQFCELGNKVAQLEADLEERTNQYHLAHAKISSRDAIIKQLSETQLAKDVAQLESKLDWVIEVCKEPNYRTRYTLKQACEFLDFIIAKLEEGNDGTK